MAPLEWYYAKDNRQQGPVSAAELKQLAGCGQLKPDDLVWCEKLEGWTPAKRVGGLFEEDAPPVPPKPGELPPKLVEPPPKPGKVPPRHPPPRETAPAFEKSETAFKRSRKRSGPHVFDLVLAFARTQFTTHFVELTSKIFTLTGHYGLYLAMAVLLGFSLFVGVKTKDVTTILLGLAVVVILFVLQYTALRYFGALDRLNRSTPARMCSAAFLDCYALLHMFGGLVILLGLAFLAVQTGPRSLVLSAIAAFILCQYVAVLALNPESLNLTITSQATAGEEAIGVLSFLVKLGLRIVPVAFGVGVVWGTVTLGYAAVLVFLPPEDPAEIAAFVEAEAADAPGPAEEPFANEARIYTPQEARAGAEGTDLPEQAALDEQAMKMLPAMVTARRAETTLITFAALPFLTYVFFLVFYLGIDVLHAILVLSGKLDRMIDD